MGVGIFEGQETSRHGATERFWGGFLRNRCLKGWMIKIEMGNKNRLRNGPEVKGGKSPKRKHMKRKQREGEGILIEVTNNEGGESQGRREFRNRKQGKPDKGRLSRRRPEEGQMTLLK